MWQIAVDEPAPFELLSPRSLDEAGELAARHGGDCALLAGGTDLLDQLKQHRRTPRYVINLKTIPGLRTLEVTSDRISIGALTTVGELERSPELKRLCPALAVGRIACGDPADPERRHARVGISCRTRDARTIADPGTAIAPAAFSAMRITA